MSGPEGNPIIAVDVGNSSIDLARLDRILTPGLLPTPCARTKLPRDADLTELAAWVEAAGAGQGIPWFVASVQSAALERLRQWHQKRCQESPPACIHVLRQHDFPLLTDVDSADQLGCDRMAAAVAANHLRQDEEPIVVIDVGTAVTVDWIDAKGVFRGGAILPGLRLALRALADGTDRLPDLAQPLVASPQPVGRDTEDAMRIGVFWGMVGGIRQIVDRVRRAAGGNPRILLTGGASLELADHLPQPLLHEPDLVLAGIALTAHGILQTNRLDASDR